MPAGVTTSPAWRPRCAKITKSTLTAAPTAVPGNSLHRNIDLALIALASLSGAVFLMAFGVILHLNPRHAFWLEVVALVGFALSALIWLGVAVTTPAPMAVVDAAKLGARRVHDRLPAEIRERLPEEFRLKITGS